MRHSSSQRGASRFGFRLRTLLVLFVIAAIFLTWWGRRQRIINDERRSLEGTWRMVNDDGSPVFMPNGQPLTVEFTPGGFSIDPFQKPKQIDFTMSNAVGVSSGIYRWEGTKLRVKQASQYVERPVSFAPTPPLDVKLKKGVPRLMGISTYTAYLLERLDEPSPQ